MVEGSWKGAACRNFARNCKIRCSNAFKGPSQWLTKINSYGRELVENEPHTHLYIADEVKPAYRRKRRDKPIRKAILLSDNARPHTAALI